MSRIVVTVSSLAARPPLDVVVVPVYFDRKIATTLPKALEKIVREQMRKLEFKGGWGAAELIPAPAGRIAPFLALVGMGKEESNPSAQAEAVRRAMGKIFQDARRHALRQIGALLPAVHSSEIAMAVVESAELTNYRFAEHRKQLQKDQAKRALRKLVLFAPEKNIPIIRRAVTNARTTLAGVTLTRTLVDQPAGHASPLALVEAARAIAQDSEDISLTVFDRKEAAKRKFNAFLAVAQGSIEEPYVIHLTYKHPAPLRRIALVGKGITFDSGGLSLKPAQHMTDMKIDMAGAATVLGVFSVLKKLKLPIEVHGIIAACENMPSGSAYRPGDVVEAMNGKTIEIQNTDAEGRVTLADALTYACQQNVDTVIDIATLTGAVMVALGETHAGMWTNDSKLGKNLLQSAKRVGEGLVALPLPVEYRPMIQSTVADLTNAAGNHPVGGAITAALFLQEFVKGVAWAHLDVAGPVHMRKAILSYYASGATGYGVRTLVDFLKTTGSQA
ncbi:MAG: leucyl aminopeptidase [Candidatus Andersenbacteria bacterium]|nr:leucyl aminopeptidase [Candidatus Andersenbacteria bacterium]MBI3251165.1 leucyl aminopeptidase [Candidatus Andersenbacteria bacterium]